MGRGLDGGWCRIDPTNDILAGYRHVIGARGRDYADVPPIKGVYAGLRRSNGRYGAHRRVK